MKNSTAEQYNNRNVIRQMVEIREKAENATADVDLAVQKGDAAMVKATEALAKAEAVNQLATDAHTNANAALVKAEDAKATAQAVDGKAQTALENSDIAITDAGDALETASAVDAKATQAQTDAGSALLKAEDAVRKADSALSGLDGKQDKGDYALRSELPDITPLATKAEVTDGLAEKQDTLVPGANITIVGNVISATGGGPVEGYLPLTGGTLTGPLEVPDINLVLDADTQKVMPARQVFQYINETDDAIARIDRELEGKQPVGEYATIAQLNETNGTLADTQRTANAADGKADANALIIAKKQNKLTAGTGISIVGDVISTKGVSEDALPKTGGAMTGYLADKDSAQVRNIAVFDVAPENYEGLDGDVCIVPVQSAKGVEF